MEHLIVGIAAALAGIGTGLVGLSAATAMVPLLIVLCPTFAGEHGAFMATALALASDILGSAVTTAVYAKNKKIDLKHGWIMTACIIGMCTLGSVAAYFTHQSVLGGFSLLLCIAIGIRFLVKPDSKDKPDKPEGARLSAKEIAVSLFFGLTIGFGTGFFGTGGGMMMLIVFTAMLGYDRKTAVGTSTFIMTFTALIASVSHILMEPSIIFECWDYLVIAVVVATFFSLVSARFANKVNGRVVGYVTGAVLLVLGVAMTVINNIDAIVSFINVPLLFEFLKLFGIYIAFIAVFAAMLLILRFTTKVPDFIFRKLLHAVAFSSILPLALFTEIWWIAVAVQALFLILVFIALIVCERFKFYSELFVEKGKHEVIISFITLFTLLGAMLAFFWGVFGEGYKYLAITAVMAWGPGDAAAAIIGRCFGKHKLEGRMIEGTKSVEGCVAMGVTSFACTALVLFLMSALAWYVILPLSLLVATVATFTELFTKRGFDTITVPAASAALLMLVFLF